MESEPQINFRGMEPSPSVEEVVRERIARLGRFHDRITFCAVVIEAPHRHGRQGKLYRVLVDIAVPGAAIPCGAVVICTRARRLVCVMCGSSTIVGMRAR